MTKQQAIEAGTLHASMALAFAEIEAATKDANNPHFKSKYADLGAVVAAIKPALVANGLFFTQRCHPDENGVSVETVLHHAGGDDMSLGTLYVPANKKDAQGFGSALTYARRYGLMTAFGVPTEDDDGNAAVRSAPKQEPQFEGISDSDRDLISTLAPAAGKTIQGICEAYRIASLKELSAKQGAAVIKKLQETVQEPA